jgi:V/A-type H+-transporting ATPase subunit K
MYWLVGLMTASLLGMMALGVYYEFRPLPRAASAPAWWRGTVATNLLLFVAAELGLLLLGVQDVMAQEAAAAPPTEVGVGLGLALIGIGIPTAFAAIGAGIAVGPVGASSLAVISEKPEMFGRSLIYLGLAEGIAIYGVVISIILLGKIA